ncbi:Sepiapterin reductase [Trinorchestia longiramus]|nr:Sepiapterin reductase [Trinorchestia longiramus]
MEPVSLAVCSVKFVSRGVCRALKLLFSLCTLITHNIRVMTWGKTVAVVTGASRGIGATLCERLSLRLGPGSVVIGIARDEQKLQDLAQRIAQSTKDVTFVPVRQDLSSPDPDTLNSAFAAGFEQAQSCPGGQINTALMVHNAGSLDPLRYVRNLDDFTLISKYYDLNLSSVYVVNAAFLRAVKSLQAAQPSLAVKVVNITSLAAVSPIKSWALYCSGKAGRDMLFRVLAAEEPSISVLNYAPGPVSTDMHHMAATETPDEEVREMFCKSVQDNKVLAPEQTIDKLLQLLEEGSYTSGDHVDYYDR